MIFKSTSWQSSGCDYPPSKGAQRGAVSALPLKRPYKGITHVTCNHVFFVIPRDDTTDSRLVSCVRAHEDANVTAEGECHFWRLAFTRMQLNTGWGQVWGATSACICKMSPFLWLLSQRSLKPIQHIETANVGYVVVIIPITSNDMQNH